MCEPYTPPSDYSSDSQEEAAQPSEAADFFLQNQLPNMSNAQSLAATGGPSVTIPGAMPTSSNRDAAAIAEHHASRTAVGPSPNLVPGNALQLLLAFQILQQSMSTIAEQLTAQTPTASQEVQLQTQPLTIAGPSAQKRSNLSPFLTPVGLWKRNSLPVHRTTYVLISLSTSHCHWTLNTELKWQRGTRGRTSLP